jgi:hypothetical protein
MLGTVRFNLRIDKKMKDGKCPIHMIYSLAGVRTVYNTKLSCFEEYWDKESQSVKQVSKSVLKDYPINLLWNKVEIDEFNSDLKTIKARVVTIEDLFKGRTISSKLVIDELKDQVNPKIDKSEPRSQVYDFIDKYIHENQATRVKGSLKVYNTLKNHLKNFEIYRRSKITFKDINYGFFQEFQALDISD